MHKTPCTIMRGGTSKGVFFRLEDMPEDQSAWPDFLLDVMGSPDDRQIDGLGGANSLTSKVAIIKASDDPAYDVEYTFAQVSIGTRLVDFQGNCGNISSAVGPYAVNTGLVPAVAPVTTVRIHNTNTDKLIVAEVAVEDGRAKTHGNARIPGVPGTGSPVYLSFYDSGGGRYRQAFANGQRGGQHRNLYGEHGHIHCGFRQPAGIYQGRGTLGWAVRNCLRIIRRMT